MTEEITPLSEKERMGQNALPLNGVFFLTEDVREFIRLLKKPYEDIIKNYDYNSLFLIEEANKEINRIDKLAGDLK